ncbi:MAG: hypothetical protein WCO96_10115 [Actinomycetes bacterium]
MRGTPKLAIVAALAVAAFGAAPGAAGAASKACNGSTKLCSKTLDKVVLPGSHNAMSSRDIGWGIPNHDISMAKQLRAGIRAMLIDTHYGVPKLVDFGPSLGGVRTIIDDASASTPGASTYLCHSSCLYGATPLAQGLKTVADFLAANPREVMVFVVEDYLSPADFAAAVTASGLGSYVYKGSVTRWPTLKSMIDSKQRVVMLSEGSTGTVSWYRSAYTGAMQETPYSFVSASLLTTSTSLAASCVPNRGARVGGLFLMNHFVTRANGISYADDSKLVNTKTAIVNRARACQTARGKLPTILAVNNVEFGSVVSAAKSLNGV